MAKAASPRKDRRGTRPGEGVYRPPHGGLIGNPEFKPTEAQRVEVRTLAKVVSAQMIADVMGISKVTLYRHFKTDLAEGKRQAAISVGGMILKKALMGNLTAAIFYAKTQLGWRERIEVDDNPDGEGGQAVDDPAVLGALIAAMVKAGADRKAVAISETVTPEPETPAEPV